MKNLAYALPCAFVLAAGACGATDKTLAATDDAGLTGSGTSVGSVDGHTLVVRSASFVAGDPNADQRCRIFLSSAKDFCALSAANKVPANHVSLGANLYIGPTEGPRSPLAPATYNVTRDNPTDGDAYATGSFAASDGNCNALVEDTQAAIEAGSVTLTSVTADGVTGTYEVTLAKGSLRGSFVAKACPGADLLRSDSVGNLAVTNGSCVQEK